MKYTAIYVESWVNGGHRSSQTVKRKIERKDGESIGEMLEREGVADSLVFLFAGHVADVSGEV
jgi:hypothetical protein